MEQIATCYFSNARGIHQWWYGLVGNDQVNEPWLSEELACGGLGAGMIGLNSLYVGLFSAVISFLALWAGNFITEFIEKWNFGNKATIIAGISLILLGLKQII